MASFGSKSFFFKLLSVVLGVACGIFAANTKAAPVLFAEPTGSVRFEQYTNGGGLALWRLPTPGASVFPGGSCVALVLPGTTEQNRFFAIYMQSQTLGTNFFVRYETTNCGVLSFGMEN